MSIADTAPTPLDDDGPRTALITGADSGVARELATLFAEDRHHLILVGRAGPALRETAEALRNRHRVRVMLIEADLSDPGAPQRVYDRVRARGIFVSYLVNDAGQESPASLASGDLQQELALIQANVASVLTLTKLFLRDMLARDEGRILHLSLTARVSGPLSAVHGGCRAFVQNFTAAAVEELRDTRVTMTALMPETAKPPGRLARESYRTLMLGGAVGSPPGVAFPSPARLPRRDTRSDDGVVAARMRTGRPMQKAGRASP